MIANPVPNPIAQSSPEASVFELSRDAIIVVDQDQHIQYWSPGAARMFGHDAAHILGQRCSEVLSPDFPAQFDFPFANATCHGHWKGELLCYTRSHQPVTVLSRWELDWQPDGRSFRMLISNTEIGDWKSVVERAVLVHQSKRDFNALFWHHPDGVFAVAPDATLVAVNPALCALTGYSRENLLTMQLALLAENADLPGLRSALLEALRGKPQTRDFICLRADGSRLESNLTLLPQIADDRIVGVHGIVRDISQRKRDERRILYLANHDALTGLPNRNLLQDRMQHAMELAQRQGNYVAVLFLDLNRFKVINDSLGHDKGDLLLQIIAERLRSAVREVDTVARLGGDEFVVLIEGVREAEQLNSVASSLLDAVCQPIMLDAHLVNISTSIGAALFPKDGTTAGALLKNADLAMYAAKGAGLGQWRLYLPDMDIQAMSRLMRENSLRHGIDSGQMLLHYQPRLDMNANRLAGVEALVRWDNPEKGLVYPASFIALAEEIGMIDTLGEWVLNSACQQMRTWLDNGMNPIKLSVNVSPLQLHSERFCSSVVAAMERARIEPYMLELEITESTLMENLDVSSKTLAQFREHGISLSIDDFGTGYSSLSYLRRLPIDTLKIDKSFVRDIPGNKDDSAIVTATIAMAHSMHLRVVAEGVTSFDQMHMLREHGCDEIQGYLLCQPLPPDEIESFFRTCALRGIQYSWAH